MMNILGKVFGTKNDREIKKYRQTVAVINGMEPELQKLSDEQLHRKIPDPNIHYDSGR